MPKLEKITGTTIQINQKIDQIDQKITNNNAAFSGQNLMNANARFFLQKELKTINPLGLIIEKASILPFMNDSRWNRIIAWVGIDNTPQKNLVPVFEYWNETGGIWTEIHIGGAGGPGVLAKSTPPPTN
jgi:hypothetical protein